MKQTAVEWLIDKLEKHYVHHDLKNTVVFQQAKAMEEKQHQETFKQSRLAKIFEKDMPPVWESFEQYYNETYNQ